MIQRTFALVKYAACRVDHNLGGAGLGSGQLCLVRWVFGAYATGAWTLHSLAEELASKGLTFRPEPRTTTRPVAANKLHEILHNRYYIGFVSWRGVEYQGRHPALVQPDLFEEVQAVLEAHRTAGARGSVREHFLVGSLRCGRCGEKLLYTVSTGKSGKEYGYFYCASRVERRSCGLRYLPQQLVEEEIEAHWAKEKVPPSDVIDLRAELEAELIEWSETSAREQQQLVRRRDSIRRERLKWAEKAMAGAVPDDIAAEKQRELAGQLLTAEASIARQLRVGDVHQQTLETIVALVEHAGRTYATVPDSLKRSLNQAWFRCLRIDEDESSGVQVVNTTRSDLSEAVQQVVDARRADSIEVATAEARRNIEQVRSSNIELLVVLTGLCSKQLDDLVNLGRAVPLARHVRPSMQVRRVRQRRLSPDEQTAITASYEAGTAMAELARSYQVRRSTIGQLLKRAGVQPRAQRSIDAPQVEEAVQLYGEGWSLQRIADHLGYDDETIRTHLRRQGVVLRPARRPGAGPAE